ncbi:hypothetical protein TNCV_4175731 [Trichonephila clavipes]|nr:hypothetical protein TNCV_4175731 [Trichonephila clavipes]
MPLDNMPDGSWPVRLRHVCGGQDYDSSLTSPVCHTPNRQKSSRQCFYVIYGTGCLKGDRNSEYTQQKKVEETNYRRVLLPLHSH